MLNAIVLIIFRNVNVHQALKEIQHQIKDVLEYHQYVLRRKNVQLVICVLQDNVIYHAVIHLHVLLAKDASIIFVRKSVTQITIVCPVKYVMKVEHVNQDVLPILTVHQQKFVSMLNANVVLVLLEHHTVVRILMNAQSSHVIRRLFAKIFQDHTNVYVQQLWLAMLIRNQVVAFQINVIKMKIATII
jgi:AraC-like DNA-binding protein